MRYEPRNVGRPTPQTNEQKRTTTPRDPNKTKKQTNRLMGLRGYRIGNVDVTLILQKPKVTILFCMAH